MRHSVASRSLIKSLMGAEVVVRQGFPIGEQHAAQSRLRQLAQQALGVGRIGRHDNPGAAASRLVTRSQLRQQSRIGTGKGTRQGVALAGGELR